MRNVLSLRVLLALSYHFFGSVLDVIYRADTDSYLSPITFSSSLTCCKSIVCQFQLKATLSCRLISNICPSNRNNQFTSLRLPRFTITNSGVGGHPMASTLDALVESAVDDMYSCEPHYGTHLDPDACVQAASQLPAGNVSRPYSLTGETPPFSIPWQGTYG